MKVNELIKMTYLERNQTVELYDYNIDENYGYDRMLPPLVWGQFTCEEVTECKYNVCWEDLKNRNVVYFGIKDNTMFICIDYDDKGGYIKRY